MATNVWVTTRARNIEAAGAALLPGRSHLWSHPKLPHLVLKKLPVGDIDVSTAHTLAFFGTENLVVLGGPVLQWAMQDPVVRIGRLLRQNQSTTNTSGSFNYGVRRTMPKFCTSSTYTAGKGYMYLMASWSDTLMRTESYGDEYGSQYNLDSMTHVAQVLTASESTYLILTNATTTADSGTSIPGCNYNKYLASTPVQGFMHRTIDLGLCRSVFGDAKVRDRYLLEVDEQEARDYLVENWVDIVNGAFGDAERLNLGVTWDYARGCLVTRGNRVFTYDYAPPSNAVTLHEPDDGREPEYGLGVPFIL